MAAVGSQRSSSGRVDGLGGAMNGLNRIVDMLFFFIFYLINRSGQQTALENMSFYMIFKCLS